MKAQSAEMAVKVQQEDEIEDMEVDVISSEEPCIVDKPPVVNGDISPRKYESVLKNPSDHSSDLNPLLSNFANMAYEIHKQSFESTQEDIRDSLKSISSLLQETEKIAQDLDKFIADTKSIFRISIPHHLNNSSANRASSKSASSNIHDGLEILSTVTDGPKVNLPPSGELIRSDLEINSRVWAMKTNLLNMWVKGTITNIKMNGADKIYRVRLDNQKTMGQKSFLLKHLAYEFTSSVIVPVGTRIIAQYTDTAGRSAHYAGIVAEPPKVTNLKRYLIFFDDGCAQYAKHEDIYVVCAQSVDVADDVHDNISDFVRGYLLQYPERPMVKLQKDQYIKTEYNFEWSDAKVLEVDCSMVKMLFLTSERTEWIYRGSTRLKPLRNELANAEAHRLEGKNRRRHNIPRKPHQPYIEYTREVEDVVLLDSDSEDDKLRKTTAEIKTNKPKNTARKSLATRPFPSTLNVRANTVYHVQDKKSHFGLKELKSIKKFTRVPYDMHDCDADCQENVNLQKYKGSNPFLIPILIGWERQLRKFRATGPGPRQVVTYRSCCGRHLRNLLEIQQYLYLIQSDLTIDCFSLDPGLSIFRSFAPLEVFYNDDDVTQGKENIPVSCVNSLSDEPPPYVEYSKDRFPGEGVFLNLNEDFLCACDCTDNCQNPATCTCQQNTNYAKYGTNRVAENIGYQFRRLKEPVVTGIYECNSRCNCSSQCGNRVVQNGLTVRLQMFKTQYKGWGIRCLDDIDAGQFICVYAGQLLTEQGADADGKECGDEYLAELDHIEVVEKNKEGYESDVPEFRRESDIRTVKTEDDENASSDDNYGSSDSDVIFDSDSEFESSLRSTATSTYATRSRQRNGKKHLNPSSDSNSNVTFNDSSSVSENDNKDSKCLPDLTINLATFKINARPPSPASAEVLEKLELKRKPKIFENGISKRSVAKKSVSMKNPLSSLAYEHSEYNKFKSVRSFFGEDSLYIMDAKSKGNIGRYLNHSCEPNVFVQNVFVDTHDLRFPAVAFFAHSHIEAGTELTWDYNYEVGSVTDKVMYCYCDTTSCRGRLL